MNLASLQETPFKRILFCTDFSASADAVFDFALDATVRRPGTVLYILHVMHEADAHFWKSYLAEVDQVEDQAKAAINAKIAATYLSRVPSGVETQAEMRQGGAAEKILEFAAEKAVDLIIIGREGSSGFHKALFGSVAEKIVRRSQCAVMVIPHVYQTRVAGQGPAPVDR